MKNSPKTIKGLLVLLLASFALIHSCEIIEEEEEEKVEEFSSVDQFFEDRTVETKSVQFSATDGMTITTEKGSKIEIPKYSFITKDGKVATGEIEVKVKEIFSKTEMIHSGVFPVSFGSPLNSGGEFFIEATANGERLQVAKGQLLSVKIPAQAVDKDMQLFLGGQFENEGVNWEELDTLPKIDTVRRDTFGNDTVIVRRNKNSFTFNSADNSYSIKLDTMGWGNIDAFLGSVKYFNCTFNLIGVNGLSSGNTTAFSVFKNQNTVWPTGTGSWGDIENNVITDKHLANVPMNVVVISVVNKVLYYGLLDVTPEEGTTYDIEMKKIDSKKLDEIIANLP